MRSPGSPEGSTGVKRGNADFMSMEPLSFDSVADAVARVLGVDHPATRLFEAAASDPGRHEEAWDALKSLPDVHRRIIAASLYGVAEGA